MNFDRDREIFRIYQLAFKLSGQEREAFIDRECSDPAMGQEVRAILKETDKTDVTADVVLMDEVAQHAAEMFEENLPKEDLSGRRLGKYTLEYLVDRGGMGVIYKARDEELGRPVAIKILPPEMARSSERLERFNREGRLVGALNHPNIVTLYAVEKIDQRHLIAMEWIEGQTLAKIIPNRGFTLKRFLDLAIPMAEALHAAHGAGVMHRDLKPANIMIDQSDMVKVLDFGLAKREPSSGDNLDVSTELATQMGRVMGTYPYMSPEQVRGKPLTAVSDLFSLGVVYYEMATGERPFQGEDSGELISSILRDEPRSISDLKKSIPQHLARIIGHCLEKNPSKRCQSAMDLRNQLVDLRRAIDSGEFSINKLQLRLPRLKILQRLTAVILVLALIVGLFPHLSEHGYLEKGKNALRDGETGAALVYFRQAEQEDPDDPETLYYLVIVLKDKGHRSEALDVAVRLKKISHQLSARQEYMALGIYYMQILDYESAISKGFRPYDVLLPDGHVMRQLAHCYSVLGDPGQSLHYIDKALFLDPDDSINIGVKVLALLEDNQVASAENFCKRSLERLGEEAAGYLYWPLAIVQMYQERFAEARVSLDHLVKCYSNDSIILSNASLLRAKSYYLEEQFVKALKYLKSYPHDRMEGQRDEWVSRLLWKSRLELELGLTQEIPDNLDLIHDFVEEQPYHLDYIRNLALVEANLQREDELIKCLDMVRNIHRAFPSSRAKGITYQLEAELALLQGTVEEATKASKQAITLLNDPRCKETRLKVARAMGNQEAMAKITVNIEDQQGLIIRDDWPDLLRLVKK